MNHDSVSADKKKGGKFEKKRPGGLSVTEKIAVVVVALALLGCVVIGVCVLLNSRQRSETAQNSTSRSEIYLRTEPVTTRPETETAPTQTEVVTNTEPADTEPPVTEPVEEKLPSHNDGLTDAERAALKEELEALFDMDAAEKGQSETAWWYCQALNNCYAFPEQIDAAELLYAGIQNGRISAEKGENEEDSYILSRREVDGILDELFGIAINDTLDFDDHEKGQIRDLNRYIENGFEDRYYDWERFELINVSDGTVSPGIDLLDFTVLDDNDLMLLYKLRAGETPETGKWSGETRTVVLRRVNDRWHILSNLPGVGMRREMLGDAAYLFGGTSWYLCADEGECWQEPDTGYNRGVRVTFEKDGSVYFADAEAWRVNEDGLLCLNGGAGETGESFKALFDCRIEGEKLFLTLRGDRPFAGCEPGMKMIFGSIRALSKENSRTVARNRPITEREELISILASTKLTVDWILPEGDLYRVVAHSWEEPLISEEQFEEMRRTGELFFDDTEWYYENTSDNYDFGFGYASMKYNPETGYQVQMAYEEIGGTEYRLGYEPDGSGLIFTDPTAYYAFYLEPETDYETEFWTQADDLGDLMNKLGEVFHPWNGFFVYYDEDSDRFLLYISGL